jgi:hypothetical protein
MKNITVTVPDETYRIARMWAAQRNTSVSKVVAFMLEILPTHPRANRQFPHPNHPNRSVVPQSQSPSVPPSLTTDH